MIVIIDYGMGNLRSAQKGFEKAGHEAVISENPGDLENADAVVLPGVGAFGDCYEGLKNQGFVEPVKAFVETGRPFLGICVGMQLLFQESVEGAGSEGLGILPGTVVRFPQNGRTDLKVPHMGWNELTPVAGTHCPLLSEGDAPYVYFVHSYYPQPSEDGIVLATSEHGVTFPAIVGRDNVIATQFHPEKSQEAGIAMLKRFGDLIGGAHD